VCSNATLKYIIVKSFPRILTLLLNDKNLLIINKIKYPTKGEKMTQDERTHVLANEESSNEGRL
jgi:hypothetical protein